jgi:hypothetical protein
MHTPARMHESYVMQVAWSVPRRRPCSVSTVYGVSAVGANFPSPANERMPGNILQAGSDLQSAGGSPQNRAVFSLRYRTARDWAVSLVKRSRKRRAVSCPVAGRIRRLTRTRRRGEGGPGVSVRRWAAREARGPRTKDSTDGVSLAAGRRSRTNSKETGNVGRIACSPAFTRLGEREQRSSVSSDQ